MRTPAYKHRLTISGVRQVVPELTSIEFLYQVL